MVFSFEASVATFAVRVTVSLPVLPIAIGVDVRLGGGGVDVDREPERVVARASLDRRRGADADPTDPVDPAAMVTLVVMLSLPAPPSAVRLYM